jgi:methionyl-tRNA synthetase
MTARYNAELANGIGNLASRVLALIESQREGFVPSPEGGEQDPERVLRATCERSVQAYDEALERLAFHEALDAVDAIVRQANGYLVETAPWKLAKEPDTDRRVNAILYSSAEVLRLLAVLLSPFTPGASGRLWTSLGIRSSLADQRLPAAGRWGGLEPGTRVSKGDPLYPRIDV